MGLSSALLSASRRPDLRRAVVGTPAPRRVVGRFVAGETLDGSLVALLTLTSDGLSMTLDHLGEGVTDRAQATRSRDAPLAAPEAVAPLGPARRVEVSVRLPFGGGRPSGTDDRAGAAQNLLR